MHNETKILQIKLYRQVLIILANEKFSKRETLTGHSRNLHKEKLLELSFPPSNIWGDQNKKKRFSEHQARIV